MSYMSGKNEGSCAGIGALIMDFYDVTLEMSFLNSANLRANTKHCSDTFSVSKCAS